MAKSEFETYPIRVGYAWGVTFTDLKPDADNPAFPENSTYTAHVKQDVSDTGAIIGTLTTATGEIIRIDDNNLAVTIPAAVTELLEVGKLAYYDVVRTDEAEPHHTNIEVRVPVARSITNV